MNLIAFMPVLAALGGNSTGLLNNLFVFLIVLLCGALLYGGGRWLLKKVTDVPIALTIWDCLWVLVGIIVLINFLLSLIDRQFIRW